MGLFGIEFPWTDEMLGKWGAEWLTTAFHAAGTMDKSNWVKRLVIDKKTECTTGNNGGKFFFDVMYAKKDPSLHTRLFAKIPYKLEGATKSDRLSSSVNKQP